MSLAAARVFYSPAQKSDSAVFFSDWNPLGIRTESAPFRANSLPPPDIFERTRRRCRRRTGDEQRAKKRALSTSAIWGFSAPIKMPGRGGRGAVWECRRAFSIRQIINVILLHYGGDTDFVKICYIITMTKTASKNPAEETLRRAELLCRRRSLRFTALRRRVLRIVCSSHRAPTAYEILRKLGTAARPPTAYRTLDFLETHGFLHKIKSRGVYAVCSHPQSAHACYFLVCSVCGRCRECCGRRLDAAINAAAETGDFMRRAVTLEIEGVCAACRK